MKKSASQGQDLDIIFKMLTPERTQQKGKKTQRSQNSNTFKRSINQPQQPQKSRSRKSSNEFTSSFSQSVLGKSDYTKKLLYQNSAAHDKYRQLETKLTQINDQYDSLSNQYKQLKLDYIRLKESKKQCQNRPIMKRASKITEVISESEDGDDKGVLNLENVEEDEMDSLRMLYYLEKAQKDKFEKQNKQLEKEYDTLKKELESTTMKPGNLDHLMKLQEDNRNLRSVIKKMSELMTVNSGDQKKGMEYARPPGLKHAFSTIPKHTNLFS